MEGVVPTNRRFFNVHSKHVTLCISQTWGFDHFSFENQNFISKFIQQIIVKLKPCKNIWDVKIIYCYLSEKVKRYAFKNMTNKKTHYTYRNVEIFPEHGFGLGVLVRDGDQRRIDDHVELLRQLGEAFNYHRWLVRDEQVLQLKQYLISVLLWERQTNNQWSAKYWLAVASRRLRRNYKPGQGQPDINGFESRNGRDERTVNLHVHRRKSRTLRKVILWEPILAENPVPAHPPKVESKTNGQKINANLFCFLFFFFAFGCGHNWNIKSSLVFFLFLKGASFEWKEVK